jgi:hypothetical protein
VLVLVLLVAIGAVVLGAGSLLFGAGRSFDDVERFHRARGITTGWARDGVVRPVIGAQKQGQEEQRRHGEATDPERAAAEV